MILIILSRLDFRRLANIIIPYDTPLEMIEKAVKIIEDILKNHEGMGLECPFRVYFIGFKRDLPNILMLYWYSSAEYWALLALSQKVNT
jgi:MscS family membrane protein